MASDADNIATIRSNLYAYLATESANPKPSYTIDGQQVDWNQMRQAILAQIDSLNQQLAAATGPWESVVQGY